MSDLLVLLLATLAWVAWVYAVLLEKAVRGEPATTSVFPALPLFPLLAWGLAYLCNRLSFPLGATLLGVLHGTYLAFLIVSIVKSQLKLRRRVRNDPGA